MHRQFAALLPEGPVRPMPANVTDIEKRLWASADELRANSRLRASEYSVPVLGLIFLRFADQKFAVADAEQGGRLDQRGLAVPGDPLGEQTFDVTRPMHHVKYLDAILPRQVENQPVGKAFDRPPPHAPETRTPEATQRAQARHVG
jgi:hypothetical protein